jgi:Periplasmic component of the Tol biopolymer transport system
LGSVTWINDNQLIYTHVDSLIRIDLDGSNATLIALASGWMGWHTVYASRDGSKIASNAQGYWGYDQQIYVMNSDGTDMRVVVPNGPGGEAVGTFSIDGSKLLYYRSMTGAEDGSGYNHVFEVDLADTSNRVDLSAGCPGGYSDERPAYSPDGSKIYFDNTQISPVEFSIWVMDANGSNRQQIISSGYNAFPSLYPGGLVAYYPFNNNANDESGNGLNGSVVGATLAFDRWNNPNNAYSFNGTTDSITIGNQPELQLLDFTACVWFKYTGEYPSYAAMRSFLMKSSKDVDGFNFGILDHGVMFEASRSGSHIGDIGTLVPDSSKWYFSVFSYESAQ